MGAIGALKTRHELLIDLRTICQLVLMHPWFSRSARLPVVDHQVPRTRDDFNYLLNNLSIVTEVVCLHAEHADAHREAFAAIMAEVVGSLKCTIAEAGFLRCLGESDRRAIEVELARLKTLVKDSWVVRIASQRSAA